METKENQAPTANTHIEPLMETMTHDKKTMENNEKQGSPQ